MKVAFALGGLAGNNAHGAGFLQAALDRAPFKPAIISCTSGQIRWVAHYLKHLGQSGKGDALKRLLKNSIEQMRWSHFPCPDLDFARLWWCGVDGVYAPACLDYPMDFFRNATSSLANMWGDFLARPPHPFITRRVWEVWPCRLLKPDSPNKTVDEMVNLLTKVADHLKIGIVFNSYSPEEGREHVYLNETARALVRTGSARNDHYKPGAVSTYRKGEYQQTVYKEIDSEALRAALHLYAYGFDPDQGHDAGQLDGAYFRDLILSELTCADHIFVVRPMHRHWQGQLPRSGIEMEDLKTQVMFKSAYVGEKSQVELVNKLCSEKKLPRRPYHHVELHEIEMQKPRGFFDYCFEDMDVFEQAREKGRDALAAI